MRRTAKGMTRQVVSVSTRKDGELETWTTRGGTLREGVEKLTDRIRVGSQ